jgi:hypothetical protein
MYVLNPYHKVRVRIGTLPARLVPSHSHTSIVHGQRHVHLGREYHGGRKHRLDLQSALSLLPPPRDPDLLNNAIHMN